VIVGFGDYREELEAMAGDRVLFTGPLEHRHLVHLIPLTDVTAVPSIFPEAFGMVAAEAAAGGSLPLVARHSGLAEIAEALESAGVPAGFRSGDVADLVERLEAALSLSPAQRSELTGRARRVVEERWSWAHVADRLLEPFT
jgi:glycosyltransferase involved in cell wall biosynthesis